MITPRLLRRSLRRALQWRLLLLWWASLLLPGAIAALPVFHFLSRQLDRSTRAREAVAFLDGAMLLDLMRQVGDEGAANAIGLGLAGSVLVLLFVSPFVAGATVTAARSDEPLPLRRLLAGAGENYGRMLRTFFCGLLPLGIAGGIAAGAIKIASNAIERDVTETSADTHLRIALAVSAVVLFLAHLVVDATRSLFAAEPTRRSALLGLFGAVRLVVRRPAWVLGVGIAGTAVGLGTAAFLMAVRLRVEQSGNVAIGLAWLLAQLAQLAVGWGRAARIFGLAELARADAAARARGFHLEPPATSPPEAPALPESSSPLSPTGASGT